MSEFTKIALTAAINKLKSIGVVQPHEAYVLQERLNDMYTVLKEDKKND